MPHPWDPRLVSYQYFEEFLAGKAVLEIGCGDGQGAAFLLGRAASLLSCDLDGEQVEGCRERLQAASLVFEQVEGERLPVEDGAVDVALVPELEWWIDWPPLLQELRRALAPDGVALLSCINGDDRPDAGLPYEDLDELLGGVFPEVRVLGQIPFSGFTVADFEPPDGDLDPVLDCSLAEEDPPPARYLVMCGQRPLAAQSYTVLQAPVPPRLDALGVDLGRHGEALTRVEDGRALAAERVLVETQASARQNSRRAERAERRCDSLVARVEQSAAEMAGLHQRIAELQGLRQADQWRLDELTSLVRQFEEQAADDRGPQQREGRLELELEQAQTATAEQSRRATNAEARLAQTEARLREARAALARAEEADEAPRGQAADAPDQEALIAEQTDALETLRQGEAHHQQEVLALGQRVEELSTYVLELERERDDAQTALDDRLAREARTRADLTRLRQENATLARKLAAALRELQNLKRERREEQPVVAEEKRGPTF